MHPTGSKVQFDFIGNLIDPNITAKYHDFFRLKRPTSETASCTSLKNCSRRIRPPMHLELVRSYGQNVRFESDFHRHYLERRRQIVIFDERNGVHGPVRGLCCGMPKHFGVACHFKVPSASRALQLCIPATFRISDISGGLSQMRVFLTHWAVHMLRAVLTATNIQLVNQHNTRHFSHTRFDAAAQLAPVWSWLWVRFEVSFVSAWECFHCRPWVTLYAVQNLQKLGIQ